MPGGTLFSGGLAVEDGCPAQFAKRGFLQVGPEGAGTGVDDVYLDVGIEVLGECPEVVCAGSANALILSSKPLARSPSTMRTILPWPCRVS
jgi:hypothetical protein